MPNRAIIAIPTVMLLDLLKAAGAISGNPLPADVRFVAAEYSVRTEELRLVVEAEEYPQRSLGDEMEVIYGPWHR